MLSTSYSSPHGYCVIATPPCQLLIHGPAGCGKTTLMRAAEACLPEGTIVYLATTGVAASLLPAGARTIHSGGRITVRMEKKDSPALGDKGANLDGPALAQLQTTFAPHVHYVTFDECSMLTADLYYTMHTRLQQVSNSGRIARILLGDFHQVRHDA